jgi:hypothetical protein
MKIKAIPVLLLTALASLALIPRAAAQGEDVAAVVNPNNPAANIGKIFAGEKRTWERGLRIKLIVRLPGCRERLVLLRLLGMSESEYKQYWAAQVFRGEADSEPFAAPSVGMQKEAMKVFPGAISLVNAQDVKPGMKIIKVDGRLPGAVGYPLH